MERIVPQLPPAPEKLRVIIDSDTASEIDDLYAISLALFSPDRFAIEGFVATHFAQKSGRESITRSQDLMKELIQHAGMSGRYDVVRGGDPMTYLDEPSRSDGASLIIDRAHAATADDPLWVVAIGAATNLASAILIDPSIAPSVRFVFHARSEETWPERNQQYNVGGDMKAARALLTSKAPLVWFDTGEQLTCPMTTTEERLAPLGGLPRFLHEYRNRHPGFQSQSKGFFDIGDFAWMIQPEVCTSDIVDAPWMDWAMRFRHDGSNGKMLRVHSVKPELAWELFFRAMKRGSKSEDS